jgi:hypothetical protein
MSYAVLIFLADFMTNPFSITDGGVEAQTLDPAGANGFLALLQAQYIK